MYEDVALEYVGKVKELLASQSYSFRIAPSDRVPDKPGVYVIYNERDEIIYARGTNNLRRRLLENDKCGNVTVSQFGRALLQNYGLRDERETSNYIRQKCTFKFKEIEDSAERIRLENFTTAILAPTLNMKPKR